MKLFTHITRKGLLILVVHGLVTMACSRSVSLPTAPWNPSDSSLPATAIARETLKAEVENPGLPEAEISGQPVTSPTPDLPHILPTPRIEPELYIVQFRDTLFSIAQRYQVSLQALIVENNLENPDYLEIGQELVIPKPEFIVSGSAFKIIPDSELVYSPSSIGFEIEGFIERQGGYLAGYVEEIEGELLNGSQIIERIALEYSVSPRLLLAILEYRSHWLTQKQPDEERLDIPILAAESWRKGLYLQLAYAANQLNNGFYQWRSGKAAYWILLDGTLVPASPTINAGTAGVQNLFATFLAHDEWLIAVSEKGLIQTYQSLFGYPFHYTYEPLVPPGLMQPEIQLPFKPGPKWAFTGGPHGGWGDGSAWAALDFAPPGEALGCVTSDEWVVAAADGFVVRTGNGAVIQDLDGPGDMQNDGNEHTGWVLLYMHIESRDRVKPGTFVQAGDHIGHPSCEGGISTGTHVHLARRYNGEWIPVDEQIPFVMDGWVASGTENVYDGFLQKGNRSVEAWEGYFPENQISR